jgi:hypothetical protein
VDAYTEQTFGVRIPGAEPAPRSFFGDELPPVDESEPPQNPDLDSPGPGTGRYP